MESISFVIRLKEEKRRENRKPTKECEKRREEKKREGMGWDGRVREGNRRGIETEIEGNWEYYFVWSEIDLMRGEEEYLHHAIKCLCFE